MRNERASESALLAEYTIAHTEVARLNNQVWTSGQILIPLSLTGLGVLAAIDKHSISSFTAIILVGILSSLILWGWYEIGCRWFCYQSIAQHRIIEIEKELGLWCTRYELQSNKKIIDELGIKDEEKNRLLSIPDHIIPKGQSTKLIMRYLVQIIIISWAILSVREFILVW